jgi:hypothetical protein
MSSAARQRACNRSRTPVERQILSGTNPETLELSANQGDWREGTDCGLRFLRGADYCFAFGRGSTVEFLERRVMVLSGPSDGCQ